MALRAFLCELAMLAVAITVFAATRRYDGVAGSEAGAPRIR